MFGYVKAYQPELKLKEYDAYKAIYCGLCRELGRSYGPLSRLTLSYDFTFLTMLHLAVNQPRPGFERRRCALNPLKQCLSCLPCGALSFSAAAAMILVYYKTLDTIRDGGFWERTGARLALPLLSRARRKAAARYPQLETVVAENIQLQNQLEQQRCRSLDQACEPTARMFQGICEQLTDDPANRRVLGRMGYLLGRYVYLADALDDIEADLKSGNYNPFILSRQLEPGHPEAVAALREEFRGTLYLTIAEAARAYELLSLTRLQPILSNILYLGLKTTVDQIISRKGSNPGQTSASVDTNI